MLFWTKLRKKLTLRSSSSPGSWFAGPGHVEKWQGSAWGDSHSQPRSAGREGEEGGDWGGCVDRPVDLRGGWRAGGGGGHGHRGQVQGGPERRQLGGRGISSTASCALSSSKKSIQWWIWLKLIWWVKYRKWVSWKFCLVVLCLLHPRGLLLL